MVNEIDPNGLAASDKGAKLDAGKEKVGLVLLAFSKPLLEIAKVGTFGANKYSDDGWISVANAEQRYTDAMLRHLLAERESEIDEETGLLHAAQVAWNALARLYFILKRIGIDR
jgi:hypothetical protein